LSAAEQRGAFPALCGKRGDRIHHRTFAALGTRVTVVLPGCDEARAETLLASVRSTVHEHEFLLSRFRPESGISHINAAAGRRPVRPAEPLWQLLQVCRDYWRHTGGAFDIALLPLVELWTRCRQEAREPSAAEYSAARALCGLELLHFDERQRQVQLLCPGAGLDLGGIGKGVIADAVARLLRVVGQPSAFLSFGESTVLGVKMHPAGFPWPVALAPLPGVVAECTVFPLADSAFSCSATSAWPSPNLSSLTLNPSTGRPLAGSRCLAVAARTATEAEVLSTAFLVLDKANRARVAKAMSFQSALEIAWSGNPATPARTLWSYPPSTT